MGLLDDAIIITIYLYCIYLQRAVSPTSTQPAAAMVS